MRDDTVEGDDKRAVEQVLMDQTDLPSTILRLPMVYGPGDQQHRMYNVLRQIQDNRQTILLEDSLAVAILPRGYVENVAAAIALAGGLLDGDLDRFIRATLLWQSTSSKSGSKSGGGAGGGTEGEKK